ncbi:MAG: CopD family protein [Methyloceanibacter sp.]
MALLIALHVLAAVVWVGGMFFAYMVLRPSAGSLEPGTRLHLWQGVFRRFFPWVWASIALLLASGYGMLFLHFGGFAAVPLHIHVMQGIGIVMMLLFLHLFFAPWRRFRAAVEREANPEAGKHLGQIRQIVAINLVLGLVTIVVGASGRFW